MKHNEEMTWDEAENEIAEKIKKAEQENFTTEIFHEFKTHSRFTIICLSVLLAIGALLYYKNDSIWRKCFESYDLASRKAGR